jgi:hypothetical protein
MGSPRGGDLPRALNYRACEVDKTVDTFRPLTLNWSLVSIWSTVTKRSKWCLSQETRKPLGTISQLYLGLSNSLKLSVNSLNSLKTFPTIPATVLSRCTIKRTRENKYAPSGEHAVAADYLYENIRWMECAGWRGASALTSSDHSERNNGQWLPIWIPSR